MQVHAIARAPSRSSLGPGWLELLIVDCRFSIADGHWEELPHHFFNRQSAMKTWSLVAAKGRAVASFLFNVLAVELWPLFALERCRTNLGGVHSPLIPEGGSQLKTAVQPERDRRIREDSGPHDIP
jgi:hypothetical protein